MIRRLQRSAKACCVAGSLLIFPAAAMAQPSDHSLEYGVKAAFLLNFAKFTQWPADMLRASGIQICVVGSNPFGDNLQRVLAGRKVMGYSLTSRNVAAGENLDACQVVYVPASADAAPLLESLKQRPVLTVGEGEEFNRMGGIIQLFIVDGRLRFSVNNAIARGAGLQLSSQMLGIATGVIP